jgi:hypothetical protein
MEPVKDVCFYNHNYSTCVTYAEEGLYRARDPETKLYGYVSADGTWAVEPQYESASIFTGGRGFVKLDEQMYMIDAEGNILFRY